MTPAPHLTRRQLRRIGWLSLFAWVFALACGMANACLMRADAHAEAQATLSQWEPMAEGAVGAGPLDRRAAHAGHHADDDQAEPIADVAKAGCLKFCADETTAVAKGKGPQADLPGPALLANVHWPVATPATPVAPRQAAERSATVGPKLFLRLLRLTT